MPTLSSQPSTSNPVYQAIGPQNTLQYKFLTTGSELITSLGSNPNIIVIFGGAAQSAGQTFSVFSQPYTVVGSGTATNNTVNLTGSEQQRAENFRAALLANVFIFPYVDVDVYPDSGDWVCSVVWREKRQLPDVWLPGTLSPPLPVVENNGTNVVLVDGWQFAYQLLENDGMGGIGITSLRHTSQPFADYEEQLLVLDMVADAAQVVATGTPFEVSLVTKDADFIASIFMRYGSHVTADGSTDWKAFADSSTIKIANIALPIGDTMLNYYYRGVTSGVQKFLTQKPRNWEICKEGQFEWLWFINNLEVYYTGEDEITTISVVFKFYDIGGIQIGAGSASCPLAEGAYIIPCGTGNSPIAVPAGTYRYTVQVTAGGTIGGLSTLINVTEIFTFYTNNHCDCEKPYVEIAWLEPLGGFSTARIHRLESVGASQEYNTHHENIDYTGTANEKRREGGFTINTPKTVRIVNLTLRFRFSEEIMEWLETLRSSRERYLRYSPDGQKTEWHKFIPDTGEMKVYERGGYAFAQMSGRLHDELPVLLNLKNQAR